MSNEYFNKSCAVPPYTSYRYQGLYGFIMLGAMDDTGALSEAQRSTHDPVAVSRLERWDGSKYVSLN